MFASVSISVSSVILHCFAVSPSASSGISNWHCVHLFVWESVCFWLWTFIYVVMCIYICEYVLRCSLFAMTFFHSADLKHDCVDLLSHKSTCVSGTFTTNISEEQTSKCGLHLHVSVFVYLYWGICFFMCLWQLNDQCIQHCHLIR